MLINYSVGKSKHEKKPDGEDLALLQSITEKSLPESVPTNEIPFMHMTHQRARMDAFGITHVHHFHLPRPARALGALWEKAASVSKANLRNMLLFFVEQAVWGMSLLNRYSPSHFSQTNRQLTGVYYVASQHSEVSPWYNLGGKLHRLEKTFRDLYSLWDASAISTGTAAILSLPDSCTDYIFTDPPFGENIYYADLNFFVESWQRVWTAAEPEAIVDRAKHKGLPEYQELMTRCFEEYHRVLKPGRWMTVVFHNSKNSVWNAIQESLQRAGFVVADVRTLDKQQGSYRQVTSTAVKQDLVISAYKPNEELERRFWLEAGTEGGVWDFVESHLRQLPVVVEKDGAVEPVAERMGYLLFDRMVAFHVQRGVSVPLSAAEFYAGLKQRYPERDGMYFVPDHVAQYDRKRVKARELLELQLFITGESSAIQWLRQELTKKPQTFQELSPEFMKDYGWAKHEKLLELGDLLKENFLRYKEGEPIPHQILSWMKQSAKHRPRIAAAEEKPGGIPEVGLTTHDPEMISATKDRWYVPDPNRARDLEKLREAALHKEFETYRQAAGGKKLKVFRLEAVRAGFGKAWRDKEYTTIIEVAKKIPEAVLQEDPKLLMYYDNALDRTEE